MSKDLYSKICGYFVVHFVEKLITNQQNSFIGRYCEMENYSSQVLHKFNFICLFSALVFLLL